MGAPHRRAVVLTAIAAGAWPGPVGAEETAGQLTAKSRDGLARLYAANDKAKALGAKAYAVLIFPDILKAGAVIGGQVGEGAMLRGGKVVGFYRISAASYGLQLGAQKYGYALFFMNAKALDSLNKTDGWSVGSGLSVVFVDEGFAKPTNTTSLQKDVYAVAFQQRGLMAGSGLEGAKIKQIYPPAS